ncbi:MAG: lipid-A-disaccharide synthase [Bacteroidales bacterium]|nr:lipid-A-disaccharide synthase [Bacteroidales bacterium]
MKYYLIAGEASGDLHASNLMKALQERDPEASFRFFGGDKMAAVAGPPVRHYREMAYMGFLQVILHARTLLRNIRLCKRDIAAWQPDLLILVDYAGFNLKIAAHVKKHQPGLPVFYYISPKIWAWKSRRIRRFKRDVDRLFIIFPFEKEWFAQRHYPADYVGNPSMDSVSAFLSHRPDKDSWCRQWGLDPARPILAILAGSRRQEVRQNLPAMLQTASRLQDRLQVVVAGAPGLKPEDYRHWLKDYPFPLVFDQTYALLSVAHAAMVVSGTATLETALFEVPQVVCYRMVRQKWLVSLARKTFIHTPYISLVNLVAGHQAVRELIAFRQEELDTAVEEILDGPVREKMLADYREIIRQMGAPGAARHAAWLMARYIGLPPEQDKRQNNDIL